MLGHTALLSATPSLPLQVQTDQAASSQDVSLQTRSRFMWTGFGFVFLMLIGASACTLPLAPHTSAKPAGLASEVAFSPALTSFSTLQIHPSMLRTLPTDVQPAGPSGVRQVASVPRMGMKQPASVRGKVAMRETDVLEKPRQRFPVDPILTVPSRKDKFPVFRGKPSTSLLSEVAPLVKLWTPLPQSLIVWTPGGLPGSKATKITFTDDEQEIFQIILQAVHHFKLKSTVRVAGGWVRDKILGQASKDMDIVVDNMNGEQFAEKVSEYMTISSRDASCSISEIAVVKANPDQSKHLATACFSLCGLDVDVTHLRTETYASDSRIPMLSIGTAKEDASRRDFTLNALFYNINEAKVEDLLGSGLKDLEAGIIRTPLPPRDTFREDPLRILRALRFASRFDFELDDAIVKAAKDDDMHELLATKVSRERIGSEVDQAMQGPRPIQTLELMDEMRLWQPIFMPQELRDALAPGTQISMAALAKEGTRRARIAIAICDIPSQCESCTNRIAAFASVLSPWRGLSYTDENKAEPRPLIYGVMRHALKLPTDFSRQTYLLADAAHTFWEARSLNDVERRVMIGKELRLVKDKWPVAVAMSAAFESSDSIQKAEKFYRADEKWVRESGIDGCWSWKPLVDAKQLMQPPFSVPQGKLVGVLLEMMFVWRLENPGMDEATCRTQLLHVLELDMALSTPR